MKKVLLLFICLTTAQFSHAQMEVSGVKFAENQSFAQQELVLNGAGVREKFWIDLYAGALYLDQKSDNAEKIINADKPMAVRLHIVSRLISSKKMIKAVEEGFENSTNKHTEPLEDRIQQFISAFESKIQREDVFDIVYKPGTGVVSFKNGKKVGTVEGLDFKKALFGIWLSNRPADDDLKEAMLGK